MGRGPVRLVQPVLGGREQQRRLGRERVHEQRGPRPALRAASACGTVSGSSSRALAVEEVVLGTNTTGRSPGATGSRTAWAGPSAGVQARVSPPSRQAATLSGCPSSSAARPSSASSSRVSSPPSTSARAAIRPATIAAADEPRPRPCGIRFAQTTSQPARLPAQRVETRLQGPYDEVPAGARDAVRALTGDVDVQAVVGDPDDHVVVEGQGQAEGVETGTEVGAGRRHPDADRRGPERHP